MTEKWVIPVALACLTFLFSVISYFIQRQVNNADINNKKQQEKYGEYLADNKLKFYSQCKEYLNTIDEQFESDCTFGPSEGVESGLDSTLISFRKFIHNQQIIDQQVLDPVKTYSEFVAESSFTIYSKNLTIQESKKIYLNSQYLLKEAAATLDNSIYKLLHP